MFLHNENVLELYNITKDLDLPCVVSLNIGVLRSLSLIIILTDVSKLFPQYIKTYMYE